MKREEIFRKTREIEASLQHQHPSWQAEMAKWEEQVKQGQPEWTVIRPTVDDISTGGQKYLPQKDGSFLCQGYTPAHEPGEDDREDGPAEHHGVSPGIAHRPAAASGRSRAARRKGLAALTEFTAEAAPADAPTKVTKLKFAKATADFDQPVMPA